MEITATSFAGLIAYAILAAGVVLFAFLSFKQPWLGVVVAIIALPAAPPWAGLSVGSFFLSAHMIVLIVAILAILSTHPEVPRNVVVDAVLLFVLAYTWIGIPLGLSTIVQGYDFLMYLLAYWFGRLAVAKFGLPRVAAVVAVVFGVTAVVLLFEFFTTINLWSRYVVFNNVLYDFWSTQQFRGGVVRAEGAFGHSIAAGCSLALAAIVSLDAKLRLWQKLLAIGAMCAATLATLSRTGIITIGLGIALVLIFGRTSLPRRAKAAFLALLAVGAGVFALTLSNVFDTAGSEAADSAAYRFWLLDLLPSLRPFGYAAGVWRSTSGDLSFGSYRSIDNAVLYFALTNGWVPALLLTLLMLAAVIRMVRFRGGVATVALVAALPALATVALITQYALVFWVVAGLAVSERVPTRTLDSPQSELPSAASLRRQLERQPT